MTVIVLIMKPKDDKVGKKNHSLSNFVPDNTQKRRNCLYEHSVFAYKHISAPSLKNDSK